MFGITKFNRRTVAYKRLLVLGAAYGVCGATVAHAQESDPDQVQVGDAAASTDEVIVVTGLRQSLEDAINIKRNASGVVDAISAEDIGAFPDQDISESLQRISGIQIARNPAFDNEVQLRGLSNFRIELDNRALVSANAARNINFESVPSELIAGIEVYKTASADQIEGGIGGLVRLKNRRPLSTGRDILSFQAIGTYGTNSKELGYRLSGIASQAFDTSIGEIGVLLNVSVAEDTLRSDQQETRGFVRRGLTDTNGDPVVSDSGENLYAPNQLRILGWEPTTKRTAVNFSLDWAPSPDVLLYFDALYSDYKRDSQGTLLISAVTGATRLSPDYTFSANDTLLTGTFVNTRTDTHGRSERRDRRIGNYALGLEAESGRFSFELEGTYGEGDSEGSGFSQARFRRFGDDVAFDLSDQNDPYSYSISGDLNDASSFIYWNLVDLRGRDDNEEYGLRGDVTYDVGGSFLDTLKAGVRYTDSKISGVSSQFNVPLRYTVPGGDIIEPGNGLPDRTVPITDFPDYIVTDFPFTDFMPGTDAVLPGSFLHFDPDLAADPDFLNLFGLDFEENGAIDPLASFAVEENTLAGYLMGTYDFTIGGRRAYGDVGVRVVKTELTSTGTQSTGAGLLPIVIENEYTEWLPSISFNYELADSVVLRLAASRAMARPALIDLSPRLFLNPGSGVGSAGNPNLSPLIADQFDVSVEWYPGSASILSAAYFYKDVEGFFQDLQGTETYFNVQTQQDEVFLVNRIRNSGKGTIKGVELNVQHSFADQLPAPLDGLGFQANYTYVDSSTPIIDSLTGGAQPLEDLSKHSFNLVGFYEKGPITFRVAYNWRDDYLNRTSTDGGTAEFREGVGYLDASFDYRITEWLDFTFDASNILQSPVRGYVGTPERPVFYSIDDTRLQFGVRATF